MSIDTLFTETTKLKHFKLTIDDIVIAQDSILNVSIRHSLFNFGEYAVIMFRDPFSTVNSTLRLNEETVITFEVNDFLRDYRRYVFKIVKTEISNDESRANYVTLHCVDPVASTLHNFHSFDAHRN